MGICSSSPPDKSLPLPKAVPEAEPVPTEKKDIAAETRPAAPSDAPTSPQSAAGPNKEKKKKKKKGGLKKRPSKSNKDAHVEENRRMMVLNANAKQYS